MPQLSHHSLWSKSHSNTLAACTRSPRTARLAAASKPTPPWTTTDGVNRSRPPTSSPRRSEPAWPRHGIDLSGTRVEVSKEMTQTPPRRISRLTTEIWFPAGVKKDEVLERAALTCPVHASLHPEVEKPITFHYAE